MTTHSETRLRVMGHAIAAEHLREHQANAFLLPPDHLPLSPNAWYSQAVSRDVRGPCHEMPRGVLTHQHAWRRPSRWHEVTAQRHHRPLGNPLYIRETTTHYNQHSPASPAASCPPAPGCCAPPPPPGDSRWRCPWRTPAGPGTRPLSYRWRLPYRWCCWVTKRPGLWAASAGGPTTCRCALRQSGPAGWGEGGTA